MERAAGVRRGGCDHGCVGWRWAPRPSSSPRWCPPSRRRPPARRGAWSTGSPTRCSTAAHGSGSGRRSSASGSRGRRRSSAPRAGQAPRAPARARPTPSAAASTGASWPRSTTASGTAASPVQLAPENLVLRDPDPGRDDRAGPGLQEGLELPGPQAGEVPEVLAVPKVGRQYGFRARMPVSGNSNATTATPGTSGRRPGSSRTPSAPTSEPGAVWQPGPVGDHHQLRPVAGVELGQQVADVGLDGR